MHELVLIEKIIFLSWAVLPIVGALYFFRDQSRKMQGLCPGCGQQVSLEKRSGEGSPEMKKIELCGECTENNIEIDFHPAWYLLLGAFLLWLIIGGTIYRNLISGFAVW